uniref:Uncharacterized protein n=1 Tax=Clastoptera arizonana TaxID=38151 RepID=A0A1B6BYU5_9HEMI
MINLTGLDFFVPESVINIKSFPNMIRMKRLSVGLAVVGERNKIPSYYMHKVHSSFNDEGKLKEDALDASDQALKAHKFSQDVFQSEEKAKLDVKMSISQIPQVTQSTNLFIDPICKESHETLPFTFILPQDKNIPKRNVSKEVLFSSKLSSGDVFKTSDNSFVEQGVLQIPKEDLPQNLFDTSQNNQYNDIQTVEIDAVKVEEIYQDVKKYYEHNEESKDKQKIHFGYDIKSPFSQHSNVAPTFTFTLNDARTSNQLSKTNQNIVPHVSNNENNVKFKHDFKNIPETDSVMLSVESVSNNLKNNLEANKENLAVQHRKQEEALRSLIEKSEMEKRKSELEAKREKEEQKMLAKLKKNLSKRLKAINARKYAKIWKEKVEEIKKFKKSNVPMLVHLSIEDHLRLWGSSSNSEKSIGIMERLHHRKSTTNIINKILKSGLPNSMTYCGNVIAEQLVKSVGTKSVRNVNLHPIFWKMVVSIPESINEETITLSQLLELWCRKTFYKRNVELGSVQCTTTSSNISVYTCVHLVKNYNCHKQCNGMSSLMFIIVNNWETPSQSVDRLQLLLSPQYLKYPCFVSVLKIGGATLEPIIEDSLIKSKQNNIITDWNFTEWFNCNNISQSLNLMAQNISYISEIRSASVDFVLKEMVEQFFSSLLGGRYLSYGLKNAAILPNNIIRLYNICVGKLENILLSSELERYAHFPLEFQPFISKLDIPSGIEQFVGCEYNNTYKMNISKLIRSLNLPEFSSWPPKTANRLVKVLKSYCGLVKDVTLLPQIIRLINISDDEELTKCLSSVSWIQIVELWAKQVVNYELNNHNERSGKKTFVLYNKHDLTELVMDQWWLKTSIVINSECKDN